MKKPPPPKIPRPCDCQVEAGICYCPKEREMTPSEALKVLESHQAWRINTPQTNPEALTRALQVAINLLKQEESYCQCKRPWPNQKGPVFECLNCEKQMK